MIKKLAWFVCTLAVLVGIGYGAKKYIDGPSQPADSLLVSGTEQNVAAVKKLYKDETKRTMEYKYKRIKAVTGTEREEQLFVMISKTTVTELLEKELIRQQKDPAGSSIISNPRKTMPELKGEDNLLFSNLDTKEIELEGQIIPVKKVEPHSWIGYRPVNGNQNLLIVRDDLYQKIKLEETILSVIQLKGSKFDYKNDKNKIYAIQKQIDEVYPGSEQNVNFADVK
ncbi:lipoprotein BA_5634 family protein [Paenibacillus pasadenensis]|uniref:lipoprotein BA_5634 family protein n=1 Tax=Paenibacillus pasadenensis TaxID=217090 RepID=UPI00203CB56B|nr:lipoprotein BA_5634 family protein [Paenibacillus pasadenensis]MCM3748574.1 lipoprotein BA_5634 family protein [Paenibacillus pasadenensis]